MKTQILKFATILFVAMITISCNKDDDNSSATVANDNFIRCKVDGVAYEITGDQIFNYKDASGFNITFDNTVLTTGIDIALAGIPTVQTYTCNSTTLTTVGRMQYHNPDIFTTAFCATSSGTVTITSVNGKTIEGTFAFSGKRLLMCTQPSKVITEGSFKITYE
jgi:hypothetical protein